MTKLRCEAVTQGHGRGRTIRCQHDVGHEGTCGWHHAGGQGGTWYRWWGANKAPVGDLTFADYAKLLREVTRLRRLCDANAVDWRTGL